MKHQSNGLIYLFVIVALIILIYAKDMNQMRIMIHFFNDIFSNYSYDSNDVVTIFKKKTIEKRMESTS